MSAEEEAYYYYSRIMEEEEDHIVPTASALVWTLLIICACVSFWSQASVTEERFVPALNVIADRFKIPDDIAGATLMAAGASSPELFSSIVSLFITHSALGLGTIVGSEIFNQLIICAGAVFAAKSGNLKLDIAVVTREVGFYALSIILLYIALRDRRPALDDDANSDEDHIYISFVDAFLLFFGYILYVIVCSNMEFIVNCFTITKQSLLKQEGGDESTTPNYGSTTKTRVRRTNIEVDNMPFMQSTQSIGHEPVSNFEDKQSPQEESDGLILQTTTTGESIANLADVEGCDEVGGGHISHNSQRSSTRDSVSGTLQKIRESLRFSDGGALRGFQFRIHHEKPSDEHHIHDLEINEYEERLSCFMWQRSYFYTKARFAKHGWHLRWFTLTADGISSIPDRSNFQKYRIDYPMFRKFDMDEDRCIIRIRAAGEGKRDFYWMAPTKKILNDVAKKMESIIEYNEKTGFSERSDFTDGSEAAKHESNANEESLIEFPDPDEGFVTFLFFLLLYPLRLLMHLTIPDVRVMDPEGNPTATLGKASCAVVSCLIWLIVGSYAMVASLEKLAKLLDIPEAVIGVTVSAAGTSLPNYVASKVAAQNGFGNMAVSNAFGSNTFNIMIGLGLPWTLYTSFGTHFEAYHQLKDDGITESVIILASVLLLFIVLVIPTGFVLYKWHGYLFISLYILYLAYAIGQVYL